MNAQTQIAIRQVALNHACNMGLDDAKQIIEAAKLFYEFLNNPNPADKVPNAQQVQSPA